MAILASMAAFAFEGPVALASTSELDTQGGHSASVVYHVANNLHLGSPKTTVDQRLRFVRPINDVSDRSRGGHLSGAGYQFSFANYATRGGAAAVEVSWPILSGAQGTETGHTLTARIDLDDWTDISPNWGCSVKDQNGIDTHRFTCFLVRRGLDYDWDLRVAEATVGAQRHAEASGAIRAGDTLSLAGGSFITGSAMHLRGAAAVPSGSSTQFDAVRMPDDTTPKPDVARMAFTYELLDNGKPALSKNDGQPLSVRGNVWNERGSQGGSSCEIITPDKRVERDSGYSCEVAGDYAPTGRLPARDRGHYIADFMVSKK